MVGKTLGHYEILEPLGKGGMGEVYRARDTKLKRDVAIKVLPEELSADAERLARLEREAHLLAALNHPNIATIYALEEEQGSRFLVLELVKGESLEQRLSKGPLPVDEALVLGKQIAEALEAAHSEGIIHRDLKPANVMITPDGRAKVLDFGIAKSTEIDDAVTETAQSTNLTVAGTLIGTPAYMSPEQVRGKPVDKRADIWAFGCLLYEALTGRSAFARDTMADTLAAIIEGDPDWDALPETLPPETSKLIGRCLQKDPSNRLHDIADARIEVTEASGQFAAKGPRIRRPGTEPPRSRRLLPVGIAAGVLLALLGGHRLMTGIWWPAMREPSFQPRELQLVSTFAGAHRAATLSPDGSMIAFVSDASGVPQVWIKNLTQGDPTQITHGEAAASDPSWSPKGDQLVFAWAGQGIWTVGPLGSPPPRQIIENGRGPSFSSDGERIVFQRGIQVWLADAEGTDEGPVEGASQRGFATVDMSPAFSPDGEWIAFFRQVEGPLGDFWVIPSSGGEPRQLTFDVQQAGTPVWTPDGRTIVFSSDRGGSRTLWRIPAGGGTAEPVTAGAGEDTDPAISPDGRTLIYTNTRNRWILKVLDRATGEQKELLDRRAVMAIPEFSPSGDQITFFHQVARGIHVFAVGTDGENLRQITHGEGERNILPQWSPDGESLYYYRTHPNPSFRKVPAAGGQSTEVFAGWQWLTHARLAPEGGSIVYSRPRTAEDASATLLRDLATGEETVITEPRLFRMRWSRNGEYLVGARASGMVLCRPSSAECEPLGRGTYPVFSGDGSRIFFQRRVAGAPGMYQIWTTNLEGQDETLVAGIGPLTPNDATFDVSLQDRFVWVEHRQGRHELWLAELR